MPPPSDAYMHSPCVIIGGGIAGLAAAIRLTELGIEPLIIEAGSYPSHKVCGEFFSPQALPFLQQWGIEPVLVPHLHLHTPTQTLSWTLPEPAGSVSHFTSNPLLVKKAQQNGAVVYTETRVQNLDTTATGHRITLSNGQTITASQLIIAVGRLPQLEQMSPPKLLYTGLKAHFTGIQQENCLELFTFKGGYLGMAPIEADKCNIACLMTERHTKMPLDVENLLERIFRAHPILQERMSRGSLAMPAWMKVRAPSFGIKRVPAWPNTYFIGDAAATIPPATGNGLTMALIGGILAADYLVHNDAIGFRREWQRLCRRPIFFGKMLHQMFLHPYLSNPCIQLAKHFPLFIDHIFNCTRLNLA
jgi:flavin-dependent dehydrogenase